MVMDARLRVRRIRVRRVRVESHGGFEIAQIPLDRPWAIELPPLASWRFETVVGGIVRGMIAPFSPDAKQDRTLVRWRGRSFHVHSSSAEVLHVSVPESFQGRKIMRSTTGRTVSYPLAQMGLVEGEMMRPSHKWYLLMWVVPREPNKDAFFVHDGPYETRDAAVAAARSAKDDDRFVRVIASTEPPTRGQWDEAEAIEPASSD
jgi:hypothetical protein